MKRRTLLQWVATLVAARPFWALRIFAQTPPFTDADKKTLIAIADIVLPAALGDRGRADIVNRFIAWFVNYRAGADMGHAYGGSSGLRVVNPSGASPAPRYAAQFTALDTAARDRGAASFATLARDDRRAVIEATLTAGQAARLSPRPNGANLIADLMGFYFASPEAYDLCYNAAIGRETCRGLEGSDRAPAPLPGGGH
jgi:hypothetical protein